MSAEPAKRRGRPPAGIREAIVAAALALIDEHGLGGLTTKAVAERAGASEASVYYHFKDKVGLVQAVIEEGLEPLREINATMFARLADRPLADGLEQIAAAFERFFTRVTPVFAAIQTNAELRREFGERMAVQGLGPHRGVGVVSSYLDDQKARGHVDPGADTEAAALMLMGACFLRVFNRHMLGNKGGRLPSREQTVAGLAAQLAPR
jgi:AcrR family transcriptional regulator